MLLFLFEVKKLSTNLNLIYYFLKKKKCNFSMELPGMKERMQGYRVPLCSVTQVAGHRTSDTRSDTGELDIGHRTLETPTCSQFNIFVFQHHLLFLFSCNLRLPKFVIQFSYARRRVWCPMYSVQCPMSGVHNWWLCNFFAGHRTSDNTLEFGSVPGGYSVTLSLKTLRMCLVSL
jgi:hypothetical protein